jgi:hypothetical protein
MTNIATLSETSAASREFVGGGLVVRIVRDPVLTAAVDTLYFEIRLDNPNTPRSVLSAVETGPATRVFRNFAPSIPSDLPPSTPEQASFRIRTLAAMGVPTNMPEMRIRFKPTRGGGSPRPWVTVPLSETSTPGVFDSTDKLVLVTPGSPSVGAYLAMAIDGSETDFASEEEEIEVNFGGAPAGVKAQPEAMVVQSLKEGDGSLNPEKEIQKPIEKLGYLTYADFDAKHAIAVNDYTPGKQLWYSLCHGTSEGASSLFSTVIIGQFIGLAFKDAETQDDLIDGGRLLAKNLNYRFVMANACISAQSTEVNKEDALVRDNLLENPAAFAQAWGPKVAYVGWGWAVQPGTAENEMASLLRELKRDPKTNIARTVRQAFDSYRQTGRNDANHISKLMKLFINGGGTGTEAIYVTDRNAKNAK